MAETPDVQKHEPGARYTDSIGRYLGVYVCLLIIAGLQFVIAYSNVDTQAMFARMLLLAIAEAGLALLFFMHLWAERRGFLLFVVVFTGFVLVAMQYGWTDSFRMETGAPYSQPNPPRTARAHFRLDDSRHAGNRPPRFLPELCPLLYSGGFFRVENDSSAEKRNPDPDHSSYAGIDRHDFSGAAKKQTGSTHRPR
jgi:cytochrome c oxidase subunit IV